MKLLFPLIVALGLCLSGCHHHHHHHHGKHHDHDYGKDKRGHKKHD